MSDTGYHNCSCRDCFELYVGEPGEFCNECEDAGCELESECCCQYIDGFCDCED